MIVAKLMARAMLLVLGLALAGCGGAFKTSYDQPVAAELSAQWRLADVVVTVPESLTVSEQKSLLPGADIVWREDPPGDRRAQVAQLVAAAVRQGASGLHGQRPVRIELTMARFHALTFEAEARLSNSGVHDVEFTLQVVDARSGAVLAGPDYIEASLPAMAGSEMAEARARGQTQRSQITAHLRAVIAGWLGLGPDPRQNFTRLGG